MFPSCRFVLCSVMLCDAPCYHHIGQFSVACTLLSLSFPSRIYEILPQRIQQWQQSPCVAEEHGKKLLERIRREQQQARLKLQEMERKFHELEAVIVRAKQQAIKEDEEVPGRSAGERSRQPGLLSWGVANSTSLTFQGGLGCIRLEPFCNLTVYVCFISYIWV